MAVSRMETLRRFHEKIAKGEPVIGCGCGTGISAASHIAGGADMLVCYNSGLFRMRGRTPIFGCYAFGNAHDNIRQFAKEILPLSGDVPVLAGIYAIDPYCRLEYLLKEFHELGFSGVQNYPNTGSPIWPTDNSTVAAKLAGANSYFSTKELDMIPIAHDNDMIAVQYAYSREEAIAFTKAGADVIAAHAGGTIGGLVPSTERARSWAETIRLVQNVTDAAKEVNPDVLVVAHGGPLVTAEDIQYLFDNTHDVVGFWGAGAAERVPAERGVLNTVKELKALKLS